MSRHRRREQGEGRRHDRDHDRKSDASLEVRAGVNSDSSHDVEVSDSNMSETHHTSNDPVIAGGYLDRDRSDDVDNSGSRDGYNSHERHHHDPVTSGGDDSSGDYSDSHGNDAYRFDFVNGQFTNLQQLDDGRWKSERIDSDESWAFDGTSLVMTEHELSGNQIRTFTDPNGDGIFTMVSETYTGL